VALFRSSLTAIAGFSLLAVASGCATAMTDAPHASHARWAPRSKDSDQPWTSVEEAETVAYDSRLRR
jgi:hypothetical protein